MEDTNVALKIRKFIFALLLQFLLSGVVIGQELPQKIDVSGHWDGTITQLGFVGQYSLDLTQTGSDIQGISNTSFGSCYAVMDLSGSVSNGVLSFTETGIRELVDLPRPYYFILKTANLNCIGTPTQSLKGNWECHASSAVPCNDAPPGSVSLIKAQNKSSGFEGAFALILIMALYILRKK
jgi:hypothetical protein